MTSVVTHLRDPSRPLWLLLYLPLHAIAPEGQYPPDSLTTTIVL